MCGELEEEQSREEEFYARFAAHAHAFLVKLKAAGAGKAAEPVHTHLDSLFRRLLANAADPNQAPEEVEAYERLAMEPLVLARLAGFMAAHLPLEEDPLRRIIEALMTGYAEGEIELPEHDHGHDHDHGHPHGQGHGHTH